MKDLGIREFGEAMKRRSAECFGELDDWSPTDLGCALAGEVGELCNFLKKMRRGETIDHMAIPFELADVMAYLSLLATRLGVDLSDATRLKFDAVSARVDSDIRLVDAALAKLDAEGA